MNYPTYVIIDNERFDINTDFRYALKCEQIANDETINNFERGLALIYTLFGEKGINSQDKYEKLLETAKKWLLCGKELNERNGNEDMDFIEDYDYIEASFMSDYHIDLSNTKMHWWKFFKLLCGLSNSEMGDCCILNRVRNLRNYDVSKIKDANEREKISKAKQEVALHKKTIEATDEQLENALKLYEELGIKIEKEG